MHSLYSFFFFFCCLTAFHTTLSLLQGNATLCSSTEARHNLKYLTPGFDSTYTCHFLTNRVYTGRKNTSVATFFPLYGMTSPKYTGVAETCIIRQRARVHVFRPGVPWEWMKQALFCQSISLSLNPVSCVTSQMKETTAESEDEPEPASAASWFWFCFIIQGSCSRTKTVVLLG